ncbi:MAG: hypothetical protein ACI4U9_00415 [Clostridia bacterium]
MKMENYANVRVSDYDHKVMCLTHEYDNSNNSEESNYYVAVLGEVYGRHGFKDGTRIHTSATKEVTETVARTYSGSVYELGTKDPDYAKYEEAVMNDVPILEYWSIGNLHEGVYIKGKIRGEGRKFMKKVIAQDGAILTFYDGSKVFVDWLTIDPFQKTYIKAFGLETGMVKGRLFCGLALEPDILNSRWSMAATAVPLTDDMAKLMQVI